MFMHNKRLMYTVRVAEPNPGLATLMLEQFGGPQGELAAAMRYFTQALTDEDAGRKDLLYDIATEELSHLEIIGSSSPCSTAARARCCPRAWRRRCRCATSPRTAPATPSRCCTAAVRRW